MYFEQQQTYPFILFLEYCIFLLFVGFYSLLNTFNYISTEIQGFNNESLGEKKFNDMVNFIDRLLPKHVRKSLENMQDSSSEKHQNVTLLYADIVGFTAYSSGTEIYNSKNTLHQK